MKTISFVIALLFITPHFISAQDVTGKWKTFDDKTGEATSVIEIYYENGSLFGKVADILDPEERDNLCVKCKGEDKNKPILGMIIIRDLKREGDQYKGGTILDPESGKTYKCTLSLETPDRLRIRGFIGISVLGRTQYWERVIRD